MLYVFMYVFCACLYVCIYAACVYPYFVLLYRYLYCTSVSICSVLVCMYVCMPRVFVHVFRVCTYVCMYVCCLCLSMGCVFVRQISIHQSIYQALCLRRPSNYFLKIVVRLPAWAYAILLPLIGSAQCFCPESVLVAIGGAVMRKMGWVSKAYDPSSAGILFRGTPSGSAGVVRFFSSCLPICLPAFLSFFLSFFLSTCLPNRTYTYARTNIYTHTGTNARTHARTHVYISCTIHRQAGR